MVELGWGERGPGKGKGRERGEEGGGKDGEGEGKAGGGREGKGRVVGGYERGVCFVGRELVEKEDWGKEGMCDGVELPGEIPKEWFRKRVVSEETIT